MRQLLERITVPIILIEDGASYHRSQAVEQFPQAHAEPLTVPRLPAFSPQLNPIEKLWKNTKKGDWSKLLYTFVVTELPTG